MYVKKDDTNFKVACKNSTLMCIEGGSAGIKKCKLNQDVCFVNKLCCFEPKLIDSDYLYYFLNTPNYEDHFKSLMSGLIGGVGISDLKTVNCTLPPPEEQKRIADYLDEKCSAIDEIIVKTEQSVEEYKKLKQAAITEAVTKGIRPNRKMKDSGIEWIGQIPEDWEVRRLKSLLSKPLQYGANATGVKYTQDLPRYIRITDISANNKLRENDPQSLPKDIAAPFLLEDGDILFARSGATVGKTFQFKKNYGEAAFAGYLIRAQIQKKTNSLFVYYYTLSSAYNEWKNRIFIQSTIQNIGANKYSNLEIPVPPLSEQQEIADYLDKKCAEIDVLIEKKQQFLTELATYKKSLIYEYVTGKKEVV